MVVLIVITVLFQLLMLKSYKPLIDHLPLSMHGRLQERNREMATSSGQGSPQTLHQTNTAGTNGNSREKDDSTFPPQRASMEEHQALNDKQYQQQNSHDHHHGSSTPNGTLPGEEHIDKHAFDHPATYEDYPTVWIPQDRRGLYEREVHDTKAAGVEVSSEGATMNEKGKCDISRAPPEEDWDESQ